MVTRSIFANALVNGTKTVYRSGSASRTLKHKMNCTTHVLKNKQCSNTGHLKFLGRARAQTASERELLAVRRVGDLERTQLGARALVELVGPLVAHEFAIFLLVVAHCKGMRKNSKAHT